MKNTFVLFCLFVATIINGQVFYQGNSDKDFKLLVANGITFVPSGTSEMSKALAEAFTLNWKSTTVRVFDPETMTLAPDDIIAVVSAMDSGGTILALVKYSHVLKNDGRMSKYKSIGYFSLNGFNQGDDEGSIVTFSHLAVKGMSEAVQTIKDNDITGSGQSLYRRLHNSILPKAEALKSKTLLIVGNTENYVYFDGLKKKGINYKLITTEEFRKLTKEELAVYCLMYFAFNAYTEISIFDLENNELIFTRHYSSGKRSFGATEIGEIASTWK